MTAREGRRTAARAAELVKIFGTGDAAIGVSRPQLRGMVTLESVAIAAPGSVLGLVLGLVFGILLRESLSDQITSLGVPVTQLVLFLVAAVIVRVVAAVLQAVRAGRLNVLEAIATE